MRYWRIIQFNNQPMMIDNEGREVALEAERVIVERGVASFFKKDSDLAFMHVNMHGIAAITCEEEAFLDRAIVLRVPVPAKVDS